MELLRDNGTKNARWNIPSQAVSACLAKGKFERCSAKQTLRFCAIILLAAIASKPTGSAAAAVATFPVRSGGEGRDKKSATTFLRPGRYNICIWNSEINANWRCCLGEIGTETRVKALTRGLWSVQSWNWRPSQKCLKCLIAACAANNSRSKVE